MSPNMTLAEMTDRLIALGNEQAELARRWTLTQLRDVIDRHPTIRSIRFETEAYFDNGFGETVSYNAEIDATDSLNDAERAVCNLDYWTADATRDAFDVDYTQDEGTLTREQILAATAHTNTVS